MNYDLENRTSSFGIATILFVKKIKPSVVTTPLISQLVRSSTSIGANYREANYACSKKDFHNKIRISLKEANETQHWLKMIGTATPELKNDCQKLLDEALQLTLIFSKIARNSKDQII